MSKPKQGSSTVKLKPEGLWSEVLSEHVRLTIKTFSAMKVKSLAMKLSAEVENATIVQHTRTAVYIDYLCSKGGKRRQRDSACLGVLLPFSHQQLAIDFILDPGTEVTLSVKGPHQVTVFGQFLPSDGGQDGIVASETIFTRTFPNGDGNYSESGPSNGTGKRSNSAGPSRLQHDFPTKSLSRAPSTTSVDQYMTDRAFSPVPAPGARRQSFDSMSSASYYDTHEEPNNQRQGGFTGERSSLGPMDKRPRRS